MSEKWLHGSSSRKAEVRENRRQRGPKNDSSPEEIRGTVIERTSVVVLCLQLSESPVHANLESVLVADTTECLKTVKVPSRSNAYTTHQITPWVTILPGVVQEARSIGRGRGRRMLITVSSEYYSVDRY